MAKLTIFVICTLVLNTEPVANGCSSSEPAQYRVLKKTDTGGKQLVVAVDENAKLFCRTNVPWKKCIWKPPRNGVRQVISREGVFDKVSLSVQCSNAVIFSTYTF